MVLGTWYLYDDIGVPSGLVGGPRAHQDQFRGFKSHRVHARRDFFLHEKNDWRKARERELATTFDENRRAVGMQNPMRGKKIKARTGGEEGRDLRPRLAQRMAEGKTSSYEFKLESKSDD